MSDDYRIVLMSIQPLFAERILAGEKSVELRRTRPNLRRGDRILIYVTSPIMELRGLAAVASVVGRPTRQLWAEVKRDAGMTENEFSDYFRGAELGYGIYLDSITSVSTPLSLKELRLRWGRFHPPQTYKYLSTTEIEQLPELASAEWTLSGI